MSQYWPLVDKGKYCIQHAESPYYSDSNYNKNNDEVINKNNTYIDPAYCNC